MDYEHEYSRATGSPQFRSHLSLFTGDDTWLENQTTGEALKRSLSTRTSSLSIPIISECRMYTWTMGIFNGRPPRTGNPASTKTRTTDAGIGGEKKPSSSILIRIPLIGSAEPQS